MKSRIAVLLVFLGFTFEVARAESTKDDIVNFAMTHTKITDREIYEKYKNEKHIYFSEWKTDNNLKYFFVGIEKPGSDDAFSIIFQDCSKDGSGLRFLTSGENFVKDMLDLYDMTSKERPIYENVCQCERAFD